MPLFSEHISNMYYGGSPLYTSSSYGYNSSVLPLGNSYSASYLNPGGNYSNHSSLGGYTRTPLTSRWISGVGRNYSPILGTISERSTASPVRINSPRRIPITKRSYGSSGYIARPININTADIDVSKDKYRKKAETPVTSPPQRKESPRYEKEKTDSPFMPRVDGKPEKEKADSPFMPRVDGKPETGIDSSPGVTRSTIKRGRTVVRLHTIRRKDRDSPRKPAQCTQKQDVTEKIEKTANKTPQDIQSGPQESSSWRERLSDDLVYKDKKAKKSLGTKLAEKFMVKNTEKEETPEKESIVNILPDTESSKSLSVNPIPSTSKSPERRCSMEILAEQAKLLDSLIRNENLSTAPLDLSKVGVVEESKNNMNLFGPIKRRKNSPLQTTKSDHSLHESLKSRHGQDIEKTIAKRRSLKKSSSGGSIRRLDSITELPKEPLNINLPAIDESKPEAVVAKPKPKLKTRITGSVEVSPPKSPLKFRIDDVVVEEKPRILKKEITFSSKVDETPTQVTSSLDKKVLSQHSHNEPQNNKRKVKKIQNELPSPEPEDGNFWNKIGKRETIYLIKRKQFLQEAKEKHKRPYFWLPEEPSLNEDKLEEDKQAVKVECDVSTSIPNDIKTENTANSEVSVSQLATVDSMVYASSKSSVIRETTPKYSENVVNLEKLEIKGPAQRVDILKDHDVTQSLQKEEIPKHELVQESTQQKVSLNPKISYPPKKEDTLESISIIKNKETVQNQTVPNTKTNTPIPMENVKEKIEINDESQRDIIKNKETKQFSQKEVVAKPEQPILSPEIDDVWDTKELKKPFQKGNEEQSSKICSTIETSMISDVVKFTEQPSKNIKLGQVSIEYQNTLNKEGKNNAVTVMDMVSKAENPTAILNKTDVQESEMNKQNVTEILENVKVQRENIDVEAKKKIPEVKEGESKIKSNVAKIKSSKKKESSKKSASKKSSEKNHNADSQNNLSQTSILHEERAKSETKASNIENQASPKQYVETVQEKSELITMNDTGHTELDTDLNSVKDESLPVKTNIESAEYQRDSSANYSEEASTSNAKYPNDINTSWSNNIPEKQVDLVSENIPINESEGKSDYIVPEDQKKGINNDNECAIKIDKQEIKRTTVKDVVKLPEPPIQKKPVKQETALRPLIATPRPLQKRAPQVIHSSESSDSSSEEESSDEEDDECDASDDSEEFFECEVNPDGRTSTGSNDSGFDSSAPTSPAGFSQIKKGGDVPGTSSTNVPANNNSADILEQELEQSTAYGIFRKTGRFTPPARSIPRFRKYTIEDFNFIKVLGKGSFGKVLLAELRDTEYYYAVKCLKKDVVLEDDDVECTLIERKVLALGTNHPYLCHLFATFQTDSHLFFVMEYLNGGDLMFHIQQSGRFPEARARFYGAEIVSGLKFLHKRGIIYRDLKLDNILLDFDGHVRIADFGMCKLQIYLDKTADTFCGTPDYMAPEIIKGLKYNQTVDWWSFGVLLYEMLIGQSPFSGCDEDELFWSICNEMPSYPRFLSQEALTILTRLLDKDARTRLGGTECMHGDIREQAFFHAIHWDRLERRDLEAPFRPRVRHPLDTQYFDRAFTGERPRLTAVEPHVLRSMDQEPFRGFSYTNPNATDR